jgi:hypothetical protein
VVKAQLTVLPGRVLKARLPVAGTSDSPSDLNRGAGPARKASQKTSTSDDEEW